MQSSDLFRSDIVQSERNHFKVSTSYVKLGDETAKRKELGLVVCLVNIPARYFIEGREASAVSEFLEVLRNNAGLVLDTEDKRARKAPEANILMKSYAIESTYILESRLTGELRSWSGSWNTSNNKLQRAGMLDDFEDLISARQLVASLQSWSDGKAIETKLRNVIKNKSTEWVYAGCTSICVVLNLRGHFSPQLRKYTKVTLSER